MLMEGYKLKNKGKIVPSNPMDILTLLQVSGSLNEDCELSEL